MEPDDNDPCEAIFRKYWLKWSIQRVIMLVVFAASFLAYSALLMTAIGYEAPLVRQTAGAPFIAVVLAGIIFLVSRPWSFIAYLDEVVDETMRRDARLAKRHLQSKTDLKQFRKLEAEMRERVAELTEA